jgi:hypothetical protein
MEPIHDLGHMVADGALAQSQSGPHLFVGQSRANRFENVELSLYQRYTRVADRRQSLCGRCRRALLARQAGELA